MNTFMNNQLFKDISDDTLSRINQIKKIDEFDLTKVERGILSIHSPWSTQSIINGKSILNLIDDSASKDFEINIIDSDLLNSKKQIDLIDSVCHGYFESVWIENGKIEFTYCDNNRTTELVVFKEYLNNKINKIR